MTSSAQVEPHRVFLLPYSGENPYQRHLVRELRALGWRVAVRSPHAGLRGLADKRQRDPRSLELLHVHWLPKFGANRLIISWLAFIRGLSRLKRMGVRIVWTVHDLYDPEARWRAMDRWLVRFVYGLADAVIVHSRAARDQVAAEFDLDDCGKMHVVPHANYLGCYPDTISREAARRSFGLAADETAFVFFGAIRRYKGVLELIDAFRRIEGPKARLIVAGRAWEAALRREVEAAAAADPRIVAALRFVADDEVQRFLKAADIVVLPYKEYLTSGAIALAMSFGRACLVPNAGSMREVVDPRGAVFFDPGEPDSLVRALEESLVRRDELEEMGQRNFKEISAWTWARMARQTAEVYAAAFDGKKHKGDSQP